MTKNIMFLLTKDDMNRRMHVNNNNKNLSKNNIIKKLASKIQEENKEYRDSLLLMPPEKIIIHSYETVYKDEIAFLFEASNLDEILSKEEIYNLCTVKNLLDLIYDEWLNYDANPGEWLIDCIRNVAK